MVSADNSEPIDGEDNLQEVYREAVESMSVTNVERLNKSKERAFS